MVGIVECFANLLTCDNNSSLNESSIDLLVMFPSLVVRDCCSPPSMILFSAVESIQEYTGDCSLWRLIAVPISIVEVESVKDTCVAMSATIAVGAAATSRTVFDELFDDANTDATSIDTGTGVARTVLEAASGSAAMVIVAVEEDGAIVV